MLKQMSTPLYDNLKKVVKEGGRVKIDNYNKMGAVWKNNYGKALVGETEKLQKDEHKQYHGLLDEENHIAEIEFGIHDLVHDGGLCESAREKRERDKAGELFRLDTHEEKDGHCNAHRICK